MPQLKKVHLDRFPIRRIDFGNSTERKLHEELVDLAEKMLQLNERLAPIRNSPCDERDELLREIEHADVEIDRRVYELYGITEEEQQIIKTPL